MITGLDLTQTEDYILKKDKDNPTVWKLGVIPSYLFGKILSAGLRGDQFQTAFDIVQAGLKGIENSDIEFKTEKTRFYNETLDVVPREIVSRLPLNVISELSEQIIKINQLGDDESKN